jgi:hypothetical protein
VVRPVEMLGRQNCHSKEETNIPICGVISVEVVENEREIIETENLR